MALLYRQIENRLKSSWRRTVHFACVGLVGWALSLCFATIASAQSSNSNQSQENASNGLADGPFDAEKREAEIAQLIEQLGHPSYQERSNAQWSLQQLGLQAFEQLRAAALDPDTPVQIADAANYLVQSQSVVWYLDTDSLDVRNYLQDYDSQQGQNREARIQMLRTLGTDDAVMALCRLARYERYESVSKAAGLSILKHFVDSKVVDERLRNSMEKALGNSVRPSVQWILQALRDQGSGSPDLGQWKSFAGEQMESEFSRNRLLANREKQLVFSFLGSVATWLNKIGDEEAALEFGLTTVDFLQYDDFRREVVAEEIMDVWKLPPLLIELSKIDPEYFDESSRAGYLLAESFRSCGFEDQAIVQADKTRVQVGELPERIKALRSVNDSRFAAIVASNRTTAAAILTLRGMFDWAEQEYLAAIEVLEEANPEKKVLTTEAKGAELAARSKCGEFYWLGGENGKAAAVLLPIVEKLVQPEEATLESDAPRSLREDAYEALIGREADRLRSNYHFYAGLAAVESGEDVAARQNLLKAHEFLESNPELESNPDIIIAMQGVLNDGEFRELYERNFNAMRSEFRGQVLKQQEKQAQAQDQNARRQAAQDLAQACNQLAWLLGKCESDLEEAIQLSELSLRLSEDYPAYLDTLGRCYFSAGRIDDAIATQRKAVELAPYERLMVLQLEEFEAAKAAAKDSDE
ncbi:MAG: hypothetical protein AB8B50_07190 [Pirellulaceae bacterium]